ncbi:MAG: gamma carbonic anhydrase family protein [Gemmataceae bacterium]
MTPTILSIKDYYVAGDAVVRGAVELGPGANIWFGCVLRADLATITLGPRANIQDGTIIHTDTDAPMLIEAGVVVGHAAMLHGKRIGRDSLIGIGARLLTGCDIGEECLIAAGALVTERKRIPPRSVVMGAPGKVVREIKPEEIEPHGRLRSLPGDGATVRAAPTRRPG